MLDFIRMDGMGVLDLLQVGQISEIYRYPVKSFAGERVEGCMLHSSGLEGDRYCAFYDVTQEGWDRFITARDIPNMLRYQAKFVGNKIRITSPSGTTFGWDEQLLAEIQSYSKRKISLSAYQAPHPEDPELLSVDLASILIITDASLRKLEQAWGSDLNPRRFRANLVLSVDDSMLSERDWIGKRLCVGDAELRVDSFCERCTMITIDPDTIERDPSLLKKLNEETNQLFGLYASVIKPGRLESGQQVYLTD